MGRKNYIDPKGRKISTDPIGRKNSSDNIENGEKLLV